MGSKNKHLSLRFKCRHCCSFYLHKAQLAEHKRRSHPAEQWRKKKQRKPPVMTMGMKPSALIEKFSNFTMSTSESEVEEVCSKSDDSSTQIKLDWKKLPMLEITLERVKISPNNDNATDSNNETESDEDNELEKQTVPQKNYYSILSRANTIFENSPIKKNIVDCSTKSRKPLVTPTRELRVVLERMEMLPAATSDISENMDDSCNESLELMVCNEPETCPEESKDPREIIPSEEVQSPVQNISEPSTFMLVERVDENFLYTEQVDKTIDPAEEHEETIPSVPVLQSPVRNINMSNTSEEPDVSEKTIPSGEMHSPVQKNTTITNPFVLLERIDENCLSTDQKDENVDPPETTAKAKSKKKYPILPKVTLKRLSEKTLKKHGVSLPQSSGPSGDKNEDNHSHGGVNFAKLYCALGLQLHLQKTKQSKLLNERLPYWRTHLIPAIEQKNFNQRLKRKLTIIKKRTAAFRLSSDAPEASNNDSTTSPLKQ